MTTPWEYLFNGSIVRAAYESYNQPMAALFIDTGYPIGLLFIVFMALMYIQNRDINFNFVVTLIMFGLLFAFIPTILKGFIIAILVLELGGILYGWIVQ